MLKEVLIIGFNRTGTTFLISFYHKLGFRIGFSDTLVDSIQSHSDDSHGGLEILRDKKHYCMLEHAEVIKHAIGYGDSLPWEIKKLNKQRSESPPDLEFKHKIFTKRNLDHMIKSSIRRVKLKEIRTKVRQKHRERLDYEKQKEFYFENYPKLINWLGNYILVEFPRSVEDFEYLWVSLYPTLKNRVIKEHAKQVWLNLVNIQYITNGRDHEKIIST